MIKTPDFDKQFQEDIVSLRFNRKFALYEKGSYSTKPFGSIITDIDLRANVFINPLLPEIMLSVIERGRSKRFMFIQLVCGTYDEYVVPWNINDLSSFSKDKVRSWYKSIRSSLAKIDRRKVSTILFHSEIIDQESLANVETILKPYSDIVWLEDDIRRQMKEHGGKVYCIVEEMKKKQPVLEFVYAYSEDTCIPLDLALVDKKYRITPPPKGMYKFYEMNWYKVFKTLKWQIDEKYRPEFSNVMKPMDKYISLYYQLILLNNISKLGLYPEIEKNLTSSTDFKLREYGIYHSVHTKALLKCLLNIYFKPFIRYFYDKAIQDDAITKFIPENGFISIDSEIINDHLTVSLKLIQCAISALN